MQQTTPNWKNLIKAGASPAIWDNLHRIVSKHRLTRSSTKFDQLLEEGKFNKFADLTQELYLHLIQKDRFTHYIIADLEDSEIEKQISQIELTNMFTREIRKRYPESFRMSRRILNILQLDKRFKLMDIGHKKSGEKIYQLKDHPAWWNDTIGKLIEMPDRVALVPSFPRDIRKAGQSGDSQIIISNEELGNLIYRIMEVARCPLSVLQIRKFVLSKLTIMDISLSPIESFVNEEGEPSFEIADTRDNPETEFFDTEYGDIFSVAKQFLLDLEDSVNYKPKRYKIILSILKLYYLDEGNLNQYEVSKQLGISDSNVSGYRKTIDSYLQTLPFKTIDQARHFQRLIKPMIESHLETNN